MGVANARRSQPAGWLLTTAALWLAAGASAQVFRLTRDQMIQFTAENP